MKIQKIIDEIEKANYKKWEYVYYGFKVTVYVLEGVFALVDGEKMSGLNTDEKLWVKLRVVKIKQFTNTRRIEFEIETPPDKINPYWGSDDYRVSIYEPGRGHQYVHHLEASDGRFLWAENANRLIWVGTLRRF